MKGVLFLLVTCVTKCLPMNLVFAIYVLALKTTQIQFYGYLFKLDGAYKIESFKNILNITKIALKFS